MAMPQRNDTMQSDRIGLTADERGSVASSSKKYGNEARDADDRVQVVVA